jgi:hypothetical protein
MDHPLITFTRDGILKYRSQSLAHFALHIDIQPFQEPSYNPFETIEDNQPRNHELDRSTQIRVTFQNYGATFHRSCRPQISRGGIITGRVQIREKRHWVSLNKSLSTNFPAEESVVTEDTMRQWWDSNGKTFRWSGLPTELKEHVLQYTVWNPHEHYDYHYRQLRSHGKRLKVKPAIYEIEDSLGPWRRLLHVSRQVRALVLRLLLVHNNIYSGGLTLVCRTQQELKDPYYRLGKFFQLIEPGSIPRTPKEEMLARNYLLHPKQHPQLGRFATLRHGIRKLYLQFDFLESLHFFKISVGGLARYRSNKFKTCDIFDKLPNLDGIHLNLPFDEWRDATTRWQMGPNLTHPDSPCWRTLHRLIYENAAQVLAPYKNVKVDYFMDAAEEQRFWDFYQTAALALTFTEEDFEELYEECGGGIQLEIEDNVMEEWGCEVVRATHVTDYEGVFPVPIEEQGVFPPLCKCDIPCTYTFQNIQRTTHSITG